MKKKAFLIFIVCALIGWLASDALRTPEAAHLVVRQVVREPVLKHLTDGTIEVAADAHGERDLPPEVIDARTRGEIARDRALREAIGKIFAKDGDWAMGMGGPLIELRDFTGVPRPRPILVRGLPAVPLVPDPFAIPVPGEPWLRPGDPNIPPHFGWFDIFTIASSGPPNPPGGIPGGPGGPGDPDSPPGANPPGTNPNNPPSDNPPADNPPGINPPGDNPNPPGDNPIPPGDNPPGDNPNPPDVAPPGDNPTPPGDNPPGGNPNPPGDNPTPPGDNPNPPGDNPNPPGNDPPGGGSNDPPYNPPPDDPNPPDILLPPDDPPGPPGDPTEPPASPVPEPASWSLMVLGFASLAFALYWRRRARS